ncbi:hypothetical protein NMY22_g14512 [Coprinellus aureogranulatus]|nr:hypothetical protein NMY22_g14512 [Coprinellus aureogranulatus]
MEDWKSRLSNLKIPFEAYDPVNPQSVRGSANIVLISANRAATAEWKTRMKEVHRIRPIHRVVVDEAHMWFTDAEYRGFALEVPSSLRAVATQMVLLSATVPPCAQEHLLTSFAMNTDTQPTIIRGSSHRKELKYVVQYGHTTPQQYVQAFTRYRESLALQQKWGERDRWIVYVPRVELGATVSKILGVPFYHADHHAYPIDDIQRRKIYQDFVSGVHRGIVATAALGAGTDYPSVRLTCHMEGVPDMVSFVQQSSRAGRDGQTAHCLYMPANNFSFTTTEHGNQHMKGVKDIHDMVSNPASPPCVRWSIGTFADGQGIRCGQFTPEYQICYACEKRGETIFSGEAARNPPPSVFPPIHPPQLVEPQVIRQHLEDRFGAACEVGKKDDERAQEKRKKKVQSYRTVLDGMGNSCVLCWRRGNHGQSHDIEECPKVDPRQARQVIGNIHYDGKKKAYTHSPCYRCHLPSMGGNALHRGRYFSGCEHHFLLRSILVTVWVDTDIRQLAQVEFSVKWANVDEYRQWLVQAPRVNHPTHALALLALMKTIFMPQQSAKD